MPHFWLVGMMGSGKTAVGRRAAERSGLRFVDTDERVAAQAGKSIAEIFEGEGEEAFRGYEASTVSAVAAEDPAVIATGGGSVLLQRNTDVMRSTGTVVYLAATPTTLARRMGEEGGRPLLVTSDRTATLTALLEQRAALYAGAAHETIDTDQLTVDEVAGEVVRLWNRS